MKAVYQGTEGAYSNIALERYLKNDSRYEIENVVDFQTVIDKVISGEAEIGILPLENSSTGGVVEVYDLLFQNDVHIIGEYVLKIMHNLLVLPEADINDIEIVNSHHQAISQCSKFLYMYPNWQIIAEKNTAGCAKKVRDLKDKKYAAIASLEAGEIYGLKVLKDGINDNFDNYTRFVIVTQKPIDYSDHNKYSLMFSVLDTPGSLYDVLGVFNKYNINMVKIESRPNPGKKFDYIFFADLEGDFTNIDMDKVFGEIARKSRVLRVVGAYYKHFYD